ncbi:MAG: hypothetical protein ACOZQL_04135 [Myxococcota bacterium]
MATKKGGTGRRRRASAGWKAATASEPFAGKSGEEFQEAVTDLLFTELNASGLTVGRLNAYVASNKGDGGVDAFLEHAPPHPSRLLTGPAVYQFKRACPAPAKLFAELQTPAQQRARELLATGADYILLVGADVPTEHIARVLRQRLKRLIPGWRGQAKVVGARELLDCFRCSTGTWRRFTPGLQATTVHTWDDWAPRFDTRVFHWVPDEARRRLLAAFQEERVGSRRAWRFVGPPGVGKSRFVLELTRELAQQVLIADRWSPSLVELARLRVGWLVVDECTTEKHLELIELLRPTQVRLITIGRDDRTDAVETARLAPLEPADALHLVPEELPLQVRQLIAERSGGYPKLLRLYARSAIRSAERVPQGSEDLQRALREFLEVEFPLTQVALELWALPSVASERDIERLARHEGFGVPEVAVGKARAFLERQGLLGTFGDPPLHYVTPLLFGDWLAGELWKSPEVVLAALEKATPEVRHACVRRLVQGDRSLRAHLAQHLDRLTQLLGPAALAEVAQTIAASSPEGALELVGRLLHATPHLEVIRSATWALRSIAWFPATFERAVDALTPLVDETNATFLSDLFGTHLGTTRADGEQRLRVLERLAEAAAPTALRAAMEACSFETSRGSGGLPGPLRENWRPASREEELDYVWAASRVAGRLLGEEQAALTLRAIRDLFRRGLGEAADPLVEAWGRLGLPPSELRTRLELIAEHDLAELGDQRAEQEQVLRQCLARLPGPSFVDRIVRLASDERWGVRTADEPLPEAVELATQLVESTDPTAVLDALQRSGGPGVHEFGRLCARRDSLRRLLGPSIELAKGAASASQFSVGYFFEWPASDVDAALRAWAEDSSLVPFTFSLMHRLGGSAARAELLMAMVRRGALPRARLGELYFGAWLRGVDDVQALALLELTPLPARFLMASQRFEPSSPLRRVAVDDWFSIEASQLDGMVEHVWLRLAPEARERDAGRFGQAMAQRLREASEAYASSSVLQQAISQWLEASPDALAALLDQFASDARAMSVLRELPLTAASQRVAVAWAKRHLDRAHAVAQLSTGADELALQLLEVADGPLVRGALSARAGSVMGWGDLSALVEGRATELSQLSERARSPGARRWFAAQVDSLTKLAARARRTEDAERAGALPLPFVADR